MSVKIYTPAKKQVKDYGLGEITETQVNGQAVIPILADRIYKSPYSAVRELYVNEVTACKKALKIDPSLSPRIEIELDSNTRELIVRGIDSLGIDTDTFKHILAVMGNSGNNDRNITGYYGLGFFSYVKLSERIKIVSKSLESGESWGALAKSALKFETLPEKSFKPLKKTGFEITLTIKNELNLDNIVQRVKDISLLSGIETSLTVDGVETRIIQYKNMLDYFKKKYANYFEGKVKYSLMYEHIDNEQYELIIGHKSGNVEGIRESWLINVPIEIDFPYGAPAICLINVKDEGEFTPSADRERFEEDSEERLLNIINGHNFHISDRLEDLENLDQWYDSSYRHFYDYIGNVSLDSRVRNGKEKDMYFNRIKILRLEEVLPAEKPREFRVSRTLRTKTFKKYEEQNILAIQAVDDLTYRNMLDIGFVDIDHGKKKRKTYNREYKPRLTKKFKYWNRYGSHDTLPSGSILFKVDDVKNTKLDRVREDRIYWVTKNADIGNRKYLKEDDFIKLINPREVYMTNQGLRTAEHILKHDKIHELRNSVGMDQRHYMKEFQNFRKNELIVKWHKGIQARLLESYYEMDGWIAGYRIDFDEIEHEKWRASITDTRLRWIVDHECGRYASDEFKAKLSELQRDLDDLRQ
ncbi:MAG: hypothetical protein GWN01_05470 [Nitrosopumilaceae archaeon]|nr:hypothetical protein [Nitrosopumilaceae archaeon]NIU86794.1 hypothetical protein [Nitrosopumilaceae archaeon]NIX60994.1 hypothetical protein [Nitrosopumilaceae archaeon]